METIKVGPHEYKVGQLEEYTANNWRVEVEATDENSATALFDFGIMFAVFAEIDKLFPGFNAHDLDANIETGKAKVGLKKKVIILKR